eukprot:scaffold1637_cov410-Prasinococcus_capsulatus_cf.AAC.18
MEDMVRKEPSQKAQFLSSLSTSWREIPERLLILQVIPHLLAELRNEQMRPLVLPILLAIAETQDKREFERVLPFLIKLMAVANGPTLVLFVQSSPKLQNKMSPEAVERHLYPLLIRGCDSPEPSLQTEAAKSAVISAEKVAYTTIRQTLLPRLHNMATKSPEIRVRVTALTCMANLSDRMDKPTLEAMVTSVKAVLAQSSNAGGPSSAGSEVTMAVVEVLQNVAKHGGVEFSCSHVLPVLCPVLIYPGLQPGNFQLVMQEIRNILAQVESKQGAKIEEQVALKAGAQAVQEAASGSFNLLESNKASIAPNHSAAWDNVSNLGFGGADKTEHRKSSSVSSTPREPMLMQQNEASLLAPAQAGPSPTYQPLQIPLANDDFASGVNLGSTPSNSVGATTVPAGMNTMFHGMSLAGTAVPAPPMAQPAPGDPGSDPFAAFPDTTSNAVANADLFAGMDAVQPSIPVQPTTSTNDLFGGMQMQPGPSPTNPTSIVKRQRTSRSDKSGFAADHSLVTSRKSYMVRQVYCTFVQHALVKRHAQACECFHSLSAQMRVRRRLRIQSSPEAIPQCRALPGGACLREAPRQLLRSMCRRRYSIEPDKRHTHLIATAPPPCASNPVDQETGIPCQWNVSSPSGASRDTLCAA